MTRANCGSNQCEVKHAQNPQREQCSVGRAANQGRPHGPCQASICGLSRLLVPYSCVLSITTNWEAYARELHKYKAEG